MVKNLLHLPFTSSNCIGELSNFILGAIYVGTAGFVYNADELQSALVSSLQTIKLQPGVYEGAFTINRAVEIIGSDATIVGRVSIVNANPTFSGVKFDRNDTDSDAAWDRTYGWSNCLQYKAVVMIYGNQLNKITFQNCEFYNNLGVNKSAITNVACELIVDNCYFEGRSSAIYSQCNLSITNSTFNYTGSNNGIASINGCGDAGLACLGTHIGIILGVDNTLFLQGHLHDLLNVNGGCNVAAAVTYKYTNSLHCAHLLYLLYALTRSC